MTKKPAAKKKTAAKARARPGRVASSKGGIAVAGNVTAGRDVVAGKQINIKAGRDVAMRDLRQQIAQIASPEEFLLQARELQAKIAEIKRRPDVLPAQTETIEVVEGQVQQVIEEAQKPKPLGTRIHATLTGAKAVMDSLGEGVKSAVGLGTAIAGLGQIALKLFGG